MIINVSHWISYHYTLVLVLVACILMSLLAGAVGIIAVFTRKSLLADAISHASLPGMVLAMLIAHTNNPWYLLMGGYITAFIAVGCEYILQKTTTLRQDAILGMLLSVFFGIGLVGITYAQHHGIAHHAFMQKMIFGNVALISLQDCKIILSIGCVLCIVLALCWKMLIAFIFDPHFAHMIGYRLEYMRLLSMGMLVTVIVLGLNIMGALLMSTLLVAPIIGICPWIRGIRSLMIGASINAMVAVIVGCLLSYFIDRIPTGPCIVVLLTVGAIGSIFLHYILRTHNS